MITLLLSLLAALLPLRSQSQAYSAWDSGSSLVHSAIYQGQAPAGRTAVAKSVVQLGILSEGADGKQGFLCSGTLIAERLVLTAAHCLKAQGRRTLAVEVIFDGDGERIAADAWRTHPEYVYASGFDDRPFEMTNDIALVRMTKAAPPSAQAAYLPRRNLRTGRSYSVLIAGYGQLGDGSVTFNILRQGKSEAWLREERKISLVAGAFSCRGDSGGPAFLNYGEKLEVVGVISHGTDSCRDDSTLTSVGFYVDWILSVAASFEIDASA